MGRVGSALAGALLVGAGVSACSEAQRLPAAEPWREFDWPEADRLFQRDRHWVGGDGAYSIDLGHGRVLWLFGDSWIDPEGSARRDGAEMVSNTLALQHGYDPSRATADFYWGTSDEAGVGGFFPDPPEGKYWPGHGARIDDVLLLFLMEVRTGDTDLGFSVSGWTAVLVENPDDVPTDWRIRWLETPATPEGIIVGSGGVLRRDGYVYAFSAREPGPGHEVYLARWSEESVVTGHLEGPQWWSGPEDGWTIRTQGGPGPRPVFVDGQSELTVHHDEDTGVFHEFQTDGFGAAVIAHRTASDLTGPWSAKDTVYVPRQGLFPRALIYQGKAHPHLTGADLVLTYSTNSLDFGDQLREDWLYFPRFVRHGGVGAVGQDPRPESRPILFTADRDGKEELYLMDADGTNARRLTFTPGDGAFRTPRYTNSSFGAWSPNGELIAFASMRLEDDDPEGDARAADIYVIAPDGSGLRRITTDAATDLGPDFSPDGQVLAFTSDRDGNYEVYTIRMDGTHLTRLTDSPGRDSGPDWHPSGRSILFESRGREGRRGLFVMSPEGDDVRHVVVGREGAWSPDGSRIAFGALACWLMDASGKVDAEPLPWSDVESRCEDSEEQEITLFTLELSSGRIDRVFPRTSTGSDVASADGSGSARVYGGSSPQWSPDGTQLVFHYSRRGDDTAHIDRCCKDVEVFKINVDGTGLTALTWNVDFDGYPRWY